MIPRKNNFIATTVEFVELVGVTISFIAKTVELAMQRACAISTHISATEMHAELRVEVAILCNDCNKRSNALFHILGHKCAHCGSYNTRRISTPQDPVGDTE